MANAIEQLAAMVRHAEASAVADRLEAELQQAAGQLRSAEQRNRAAQRHLDDISVARKRELEQAQAQEIQLKELIQKAAQYKGHLEESASVEDLITAAREEIQHTQREAREALGAAESEARKTREHLQTIMRRYEELRGKLDRLRPDDANRFAADDLLLKEAGIYFPEGQLRSLAKEIEDGGRHFGALSQPEQYAQLKIWLGQLRRIQELELSEEDRTLADRRIFGMLVEISKIHEPGFIEAFRQDYRTNWDLFVADAQEELRQASDTRRQRAEAERQQYEQQARRQERRRQSQEQARAAIEELRAVIARFDVPNEGLDEFRAALANVAGHGASDPELLDLVLPYRDIIAEGSEFRALRRNLDRLRQESNEAESSLGEDISDLLEVTRGLKAVLVGGSRREENRRQLEQLFQFKRLEWENYEGGQPVVLEALEQSVRNHGVDLILILKRYIRHHVPEKLRPLCEQQGIPCLMVEQGYGAAQIAKTLRQGLMQGQK